MTLRVLVADDQEIVRTGLAMILGAQEGIEVVATAIDGQDAVEQARQLRPDVCLLDIRMPRMNGIEATRALAGPEVGCGGVSRSAKVFSSRVVTVGAISEPPSAAARTAWVSSAGPQSFSRKPRAPACRAP